MRDAARFAPAFVFFLLVPVTAPALAAPVDSKAAVGKPPVENRFDGMRFRNIGPFRGGRVTAVSGIRGQRNVHFQGATGGGVWRTTDAGASWEPVSDGFFRTGSVGAVAVAESDPNVVWVGMGEAPIRGNVSHGDGVWRSTDAGRTWKHLGLEATRQIAALRVHPKDPDTAWVAAQGKLWGPSEERGVYRTRDGGKTWARVLFVDTATGASDLALDPTNPRILYAGMWQVVRRPWELVSGGPGSGLYRSEDGGDTWTRLTKGLPEGIWGKVGVAASGAKPGRVFAMVEAEKGGLFRSEDWGESFTKVNEENDLRQRAWYYTGVWADPKNADTVWVTNVQLWRSLDGGKSFTALPTPHGDHHDLWIDPDDSSHVLVGDDGGAYVTYDAGKSWSSIDNQPTGQFYRVAVDDRFPYHVYGAQQDNTTVAIASRSRGREIGRAEWHPVGGCESGWIAPKPGEPDVVFAGCYGGSITRYDHRTGEEREVTAWPQLAIGRPASDLKYRIQWNAPILVSRHDPSVLWHAAQVLLESRDEGQSWKEVSPDLTRNDKAKQGSSGGPITKDNTGVEVYGTIFALAESPLAKGVLWAGSDDGLVHVTRDGGKSWRNVTPKGLPEWIQVNSIEASPHDAATAYLAATLYKLGDLTPHLWKTADYGASWTRIDAGIARDAFTRVVREDPVRKGLLFAGTETGLWMSLDDGRGWQRFQRNLPAVPITDLAVKDGDLVVATQGRAFWILDDLSPLRQWTEEVAAAKTWLFTPPAAFRLRGGGDFAKAPQGAGQNAPAGALVSFWLKESPRESDVVTLAVLDGGKLLRYFSNEKRDEKLAAEAEEPLENRLELSAGLNRFAWDLRALGPTLVPKAVLWGPSTGPRILPGTYTVRLTAFGETRTVPLEVLPNPAVKQTKEDLAKQAAFLGELYDTLSHVHGTVRNLRDAREQISTLAERAKRSRVRSSVLDAAKEVDARLLAVEEKLVNPKLKSPQDVLNFVPALDHQVVGLISAASGADAPPTAGALAYWAELKKTVDGALRDATRTLIDGVAAWNARLADAGVPPVVIPARRIPTPR
ncbi:MAG TPA: glycosyl hydrolase [Thermoanaerobaculia bacterium]|nr:glycosyl hydrolase [Thermoanaerobaculia bacterium]